MMSSDDLDAGWDDEAGDEEPPATVNFDERELAAKSRQKTAPRPAEDEPERGSGTDLNQTIPPPMMEDDYVEHMMKQAGESEPKMPAYRNQLATLLEIDPLRFDQPEYRPSGDAPHEAPSIEMVEETLDIDHELLVNTVPPPPGGIVDELDTLPFDEVLNAISQRPSDLLDTRPPPAQDPKWDPHERTTELPPPNHPTQRGHDDAIGRAPESSEVVIQAGLRLGAVPPPPKAIEDLPYDRVTLPGERASLADRPNDERAKMLRRFEAKDYMGALILAESLQAQEPHDPEVHRCIDDCRAKLTDMYIGKLGERTHVPRVLMMADQLQHLALDHRAGFLISCIDGASSLDEVLDMSGMPALDTVRLLYELVQEGAVVIESPPPRSSQR
jgi:hypothetical protein